jgi:3-oxoacyl-[acyl-carrier-protein] synthase-3
VSPRRGAYFCSVAATLPETVVPNAEIAERLGVDETWIYTRTGITERRVLLAGESVSDLACAVGRRAVAEAEIEPDDIDLVLVATATADDIAPGCGPRVAAHVGATRAAGVDLNSSCTGFLAALSVAASSIEADRARHVLVVAAEAPSRFLDRDDRDTAPLFGDGAGAVVLSACPCPSRIGPIVLRSDAGDDDLIRITRDDPVIRMRGPQTYRRAIAALTEATLEAVAAAERALDDIDLFVYHQANGRILNAVAARLGQPIDRFVNCIASYANTSAASIPIALSEAVETGELRAGSTVLIGACGAGFTFGAATVEWGSPEQGGSYGDV